MKKLLLIPLLFISTTALAQQYPTMQQVPEPSHSSDPTMENFNRWQYRGDHQQWEQSVEQRLEQQQQEIKALQREVESLKSHSASKEPGVYRNATSKSRKSGL